MPDNLKGVEAVYRVINILKTELLSNPFCNSVTLGTLTEIDLAKMTIFPMGHIVLESATHKTNTLSFQVTIYNLDIVEISKELPIDEYGNDNLIYIYTNQLYVINRLISRISEGQYGDGWEINGEPKSDFINKEMENMLAGVQTTFSVTVQNGISKC